MWYFSTLIQSYKRPTLVEMNSADILANTAALESWFSQNQRPLPWRLQPAQAYRTWISEVMLQQTTVKAVIPYFERFLGRFPTLASLATAPLEDVLEMWAGLGYYSRARNLHKAAIALNAIEFPKTYLELIEFSGFGPYTARAVSSIAFEEKVGVVDGNVIRVLSRLHGLNKKWWENKHKAFYQTLADLYAQQSEKPSQINQALMELGATICTPERPACLVCPVNQNCVARLTGKVDKLPLVKPRRAREVWVWQPQILLTKDKKIGLVKNDYAPFLKNQLFLPGTIKRASKNPARFAVRHTVTHHDIFVVTSKTQQSSKATAKYQWVPLKDLKKHVPFSLVHKVLSKVIP